MGVTNLSYYNDRYKGTLSNQQCDVLEQLLSLKKDNGCIPDLVHCIYELRDDTVQNMIQEYMAFGRVVSDVDKPLGSLLDYQTISVACMYYAGSCILGDSVGMGKTVEVSGLLNILKEESGGSHRCLLVTEKRVAGQMRSEIIKFTGDYCHLVPSAEEKSMSDFYVNCPIQDRLDYNIVGTHAMMKASAFISWLEQYKKMHNTSPFDTLVVDESSVLQSAKTEITISFKAIKKYFKRIILLNATPFESNIRVFYRQLDLIDNKFLPTLQNFQKEYCVMSYTGMYPKPTNKYKNKEQFKSLIAYRYFASTRKGNGGVMSNCGGGIIVSELSKAQKNLLSISQLNTMIYDCPSYIDDTIEYTPENVPKLGSLKDLLEGNCKDSSMILIFVLYREAQYQLSKWLSENGYTNRVLNGGTSYKDSDKIIEDFKNNQFRVLITNTKKGLNFGNCNDCIFYSVNTNPSQMVQFEGRTTRSFDIIGKNVYILCSKGKEYNNLMSVVRDRAKAMKDMTTTDYSVVLDVLLGGIEGK